MKKIVLFLQCGMTILVMTHEPDIAAFAQRRIVFRDGMIVADERQAGSVS